MVLDILQYPNVILTTRCEPVKRINKELIEFGNNLIETMEAANGLGLAAPQVSKSLRILCIKRGKKVLLMYNPVVVQKSATKRMNKEGCLSFTGVEYIIKRPTWVKVKYTDQNNKSKMVELEGLEAIELFHELDHLNGITFDQIEDKLEIKKDEKESPQS